MAALLAVISVALFACDKKKSESETPTSMSAPVESEPSAPRRGAPPQSFEACNGKNSGDPCTVKLRDEEHTGKCWQPPPEAPDPRLRCRLERRRPSNP